MCGCGESAWTDQPKGTDSSHPPFLVSHTHTLSLNLNSKVYSKVCILSDSVLVICCKKADHSIWISTQSRRCGCFFINNPLNFLACFQFPSKRLGSPSLMASSSGNDDDLTIPRAAINKMIKETLPNVRVANDARELVVNCCTEFIHLVSSEANEICNKSEKKTISPEHVINGEDVTNS